MILFSHMRHLLLTLGTGSPMSLYDFYMYLKYIEHSSENLEFYIWFKNYQAGRLTAFQELPRGQTPLANSDAASENSLSKPDNFENFGEKSIDGSESQDSTSFEDGRLFR